MTDSHFLAWRYARQTMLGMRDQPRDPPKPVGLLIGEMPGATCNSRLPMFPDRPHRSSARLISWAGVSIPQYLGLTRRYNACPHAPWDAYLAERQLTTVIGALIGGSLGEINRVLLCGRRASTALLGYKQKQGPFGVRMETAGITFAWIPHPSGLNRIYNNPKNCDLAGHHLRWLIGLDDLPGGRS